MSIFLTGPHLAQLVPIPLNTFRSLRERVQVPLVWHGDAAFILSERSGPKHVPVDDPAREAARGYTPLQVFAMVVANDFFRQLGIDRKPAADLAGFVMGIDRAKWAQIAETSEAVLMGKPTPEILFGKLMSTDNTAKIVCNDLVGITRQVPDAISGLLISITRSAAGMRKRATEHGINLGDFWTPADVAP